MRNSGSGTSITSQLDTLIKKGQYAAFLKITDSLDPSLESWGSLRLKGLNLLIEQGLANQALNLSYSLKNSLCLSHERYEADLTWRYLNYLNTNRRQKDRETIGRLVKQALDKDCGSSIYYTGRLISLRISADKIMSGNADAKLKLPLVEDYRDYLQHCLYNKAFHNAFTAVQEIVQLMLSKPFPMPEVCQEFLEHNLQKGFIQESEYRKSTLSLKLAEILLEQHLNGNKNPDYIRYYQLAKESLIQCGHSTGRELIYQSYGHLLLKYGKREGKRFLDKAINGFEQKQNQLQLISAYRSVASWLEKQGNITAAHFYRIREHESGKTPTSHKPAFLFSQHAEESPMGLANLLVSSNPETASWHHNFEKLKNNGETVHLARVLDFLYNHKRHTCVSIHGYSEKAVDLYQKLGYPLDAAKIIKEWLLELNCNNSAIPPKQAALIRVAITQIEQLLNMEKCLEAQEILIYSHQAIASLLKHSDHEFSAKHLQRAEDMISHLNIPTLKARHSFFKACLSLDWENHKKASHACNEASKHFDKAFAFFRASQDYEGMWRSLFGKALCCVQKLNVPLHSLTLVSQECELNFRHALEIVDRLTKSQVKTRHFFGDPLKASLILQKNAIQLFDQAQHFFSRNEHSSLALSRMKQLRADWKLLNQRIQPK